MPERRVEQRNNYNPGPPSRQRELPSRRRERMAAFEGVEFQEEDWDYYLDDYDVGELYYYNTNSQGLEGSRDYYKEQQEGTDLVHSTAPLKHQTADQQDLLSPRYNNYLGSVGEFKPLTD